jgi:LysM repeat protein
LEALNPDFEREEELPKGTVVRMPALNQFGGEWDYKTLNDGETLRKIAQTSHLAEGMLADLNGIKSKIDRDKGLFTIFDADGKEIPGLFPGTTLKFPGDHALYVVVAGDTLESIAERHDLAVVDIRRLNPALASTPGDEELVGDPETILKLPQIRAFEVLGDTLEDVASAYSNVTARSLAEANDVDEDAVLRVGTSLKLPEDAWGSAPAGSPNDGTACVQYAVPASVFDQLSGKSETPEAPAEVSKEVSIVANANDWTLTADGTAQAPNKGVASIAVGTAVKFTNAVGLHTITSNGEKDGADFKVGEQRTLTFGEAGTFKITCDYHPDMLAWLFVK